MSVDVTGTSAASVTGVIRQAAQKTGTNFNYLLATARVESNLNPAAKATSSSAGGLFQFIEQTWLGTMKQAGPALGYGRLAEAISVNSAGRFDVRDPSLRQQILNLRSDPTANALMGGALTKWNGDWLSARLGRTPKEGELYLAHFLGAGGASKLITSAAASPQASAAAMFPRAAGANKSIFYDRQGEPRSVAQVYNMMVGRYEVARAHPAAAPGNRAVARAVPSMAVAPIQAAKLISPPVLASVPLPVLASVTAAGPAASPDDSGPVFHGLFRTSARREALAPVVSALWSSRPVPPEPSQGAGPNDSAPRVRGILEMFRDSG